MRTRNGIALAGAIAAMALVGAPAAAQAPTIEVLAEGLNAPRGIEVAADGSLWVAEAGAAGETCMDVDGGQMCYGPSGSVAHIVDGNVERVVQGLTSAGSGPEVGGVSDVAVASDGSLYITMNLGDDPAVRAQMPPEFANAGWLLKASADGTVAQFADIAAFETANDPDGEVGGEVDSNPYAVEVTDSGLVVADAGGNDLLTVADDGTVSLLAVFPPTTHEFSAAALAAMGPPPAGEGAEGAAPAESAEPAAPDESAEPAPAESGAPPADQMVPVPVQTVPTSVTVGPDGALYMGQLTGGPFPVGGASVWRVVPGEDPTEYATGFTNILGLGFAPDGTLYVAEMVHDGLMGVFAAGAPPIGAVLSVAPGGGEPEMVATGEQLMALGGLDVDGEGNVYVTTNTLAPGAGQVLKITP